MKTLVYGLLGRDFLPGQPPAFDPDKVQRLVCEGGVLSLDGTDIVLDRP